MPRNVVALLVVVVGLSACNSAINYEDPSGPKSVGDFRDGLSPSSDEQLLAVSFNVEFAFQSEKAGEDLATQPALADADFVLLQEMTPSGTELIGRRLRGAYVYYPASTNDGGDFGQAIISRWPLINERKQILPFVDPVNGRQRIAVHAQAELPSGLVHVVSVHNLTPVAGPAARLAQAEAIIESVQGSQPVIVGGDFNTGDPGAEAATIQAFTNAGYLYASPKAQNTGEGKVGVWTLDYFFTRGFESEDSGVVASDASDHDPIWVRLRPQ